MTVQTDFLERCKALNLHDGKLSDWLDEIESLRQQLAAALAACKLKDEELEKIRGHIGLYNLFSCVGSDSYDPECADLNVGKCREIATKALAIQPDDSALEQFAVRVREQCAKMCEAEYVNVADGDDEVYNSAITHASRGIRTIKELPK